MGTAVLSPYEGEAGGSGDVCPDYPFLYRCTLHSRIKDKFFLLITLNMMKRIRKNERGGEARKW